MAGYDVNAAIAKPNFLAAARDGYAFGTQQRLQREADADRALIRSEAPNLLAGDPASFNRVAAVDPDRAVALRDAGDGQMVRLKGALDFLDEGEKLGDPRIVEARWQQVRPWLATVSGGVEPPATWAEAKIGIEPVRARIAMAMAGQDPRKQNLTPSVASVEDAFRRGIISKEEYDKAMRVALQLAPGASPPAVSFIETWNPQTQQMERRQVQTRGVDYTGDAPSLTYGAQPPPADTGSPQPTPMPPPQPRVASPPDAFADVQARLDALGQEYGFQTTSTVRSPEENIAVDGEPTSQHLPQNGGTARDYSIKGKSPAEISAFVARLREDGFEVIASDHGTGPHIHAELPPGAVRTGGAAPAPAPAAAPAPSRAPAGVMPSGPSFAETEAQKRREAMATAEGRIEGERNMGPNFDDETTLRKEFNTLVAEPKSVIAAFERVQGAAQDPSAAGDLSLIFAYMKMLDPGSVVREGEFANAQNAAGVPDIVRNVWNRAMSGERLNPNQRQDFVGRAAQLRDQAQVRIDKLTARYRDMAPDYRMDADRIAPGDNATGDSAPAPGTIEDGYRYEGGDPADPTSWAKV